MSISKALLINILGLDYIIKLLLSPFNIIEYQISYCINFVKLFQIWAKIYFNGPQFLGQSTTPALHRFLQQKRSRLSFRLYFCGPAFYTCLSNKYNILWSRVLHLCISRTIWLVFRGLQTFSNCMNISHRLGDGETQEYGPGIG